MTDQILDIDRSTYDHVNKDNLIYKAKPGLTIEIVKEISRQKKEPEWMLKKRLKAFEIYKKMPLPTWI